MVPLLWTGIGSPILSRSSATTSSAGLLAVVYVRLMNPNDYSIGQRDNFSLVGINSDPRTLACCKFLSRFFQGIACKTALIPVRDQQSCGNYQTKSLNRRFIERCDYASPH